MSITLNGLGNSVVPSFDESSAPFSNLSFTNLVGETSYTLTITLADQTGDFDLFNPNNDDDEISTLTVTATGANLTSELQNVDFDVNGIWGADIPSSTSLTFALTSPASVDLGSEIVFCFAAGTRIRTRRGEVPVEALRKGDRVVTAREGGRLAPVRWVGHRRLSPARHPRPWDVNPIRVRAGAIGPGLPGRDLLLSPDHSLFLDGVLIRARDLLNGATVVQEDVADVTYYHVELDRHDVLLAEGLPAESFLDTGNRGAFQNGGAPTTVHPDFSRSVWERDGCAKLVWEGKQLAEVRAGLAERAEHIGWTMTDQPDLHLTVRGRAIRPTVEAGSLVFNLPSDCDTACLRSRTTVPAYILADSIDARSLGVGVTWMALDGVAVKLDSAALGAGWLAPEPGLRWTDGAATLRVAGALRLELRATALLRYWVAPRNADAGLSERQAA